MSRTARASVGGVVYHVINRGNARSEVFHKDGDYQAFVNLIGLACKRVPLRVLAYCLMPNHFHLVLWPRHDGDLGRWMQWLMTSHVRRYHSHYGTSGHVWQGRFKAFPIQQDEHFLTVLRYVERNALRAGLVQRAQDWPFSSLPCRSEKNRNDTPVFLQAGPIERSRQWVSVVNKPMTTGELEDIRRCVNRGTPWGNSRWQRVTANRLGLQASLNPRGRPSKQTKK